MLYQEFSLPDPDRLNAGLFTRFMALGGTDRIRQSHHIDGRFENTYIDMADIPDIAPLLEIVRQRAGQLLGVAPDTLKAGFWFNAMQGGQRTAPHHHDENDELLSAVYYIRVPEHSGDLILHEAGRETVIQAEEGKLVIFAPSVLHEVSVNQSSEMRLSVAFNVGPIDDACT
jgi:hypothetical protein